MGAEVDRPRAVGGGGWFLIAALAYLAVVFALSHVPGGYFGFKLRLWDKALHFAEYVPLGVMLAAWVLRRPWAPRSRAMAVLVVALAALALGGADELHQWFVPKRSATVGDALADGLGGLVGGVVGTFVLDPRRRRRSATPSESRTT